MLPTPKSTIERLLKNFSHKVRGEAIEDSPTPNSNIEHYLSEIITYYSAGGGGDGGGGNIPHTHAISEIRGLLSELSTKAPFSHSHNIFMITGLQDALDNKSQVTHKHSISDVDGLSEKVLSLDGIISSFSSDISSLSNDISTLSSDVSSLVADIVHDISTLEAALQTLLDSPVEVPTDLLSRIEALEKLLGPPVGDGGEDDAITKFVNFNNFREDSDLFVVDKTPAYPFVLDRDTTPFSIRPSNVGIHDTTSTIEISFSTVHPSATLKFDVKGQSESGYDFFKYSLFRANGSFIRDFVLPHNISDWVTYVIPIADVGSYYITFSYTKDSSANDGFDCFWVANMKIIGGK